MQTKGGMRAIKSKDSILLTYFEFNHLKNLYRQGWLRAGISKGECESVADHSFGVALLSIFISEQYFRDLDIKKTIKMALLHDFGEIYGGDITPHDNISEVDKAKIEEKSVKKVLLKLKKGKTISRYGRNSKSDPPRRRDSLSKSISWKWPFRQECMQKQEMEISRSSSTRQKGRCRTKN